jgi:CheY-like chemotaxis protein
MPIMNGFEATKIIRLKNKNIPIAKRDTSGFLHQ